MASCFEKHDRVKVEFINKEYSNLFPIKGLPANSMIQRVYMIFEKTDENTTDTSVWRKDRSFKNRDPELFYFIEWGGSEI